MKIGLRVLTRPMADQLPEIYRTLAENYSEIVLPSIIHETLKDIVAQYNASQLITQREVMHISVLCKYMHMSFSHFYKSVIEYVFLWAALRRSVGRSERF